MSRTPRHDQPSRRRSFTLIESIAAVVILSIAVPAMLWSLHEAHAQRATPVMTSTARWLAMEKLEDVIADRHSSTRGYDYLVLGNYPAELPVSGFTGYLRMVTFNETEADLTTAGTGYMTVTVSIGWYDSAGDARTLSLSTVLTEYDP
jgi:prepilin-type N-terminal cleavage/methylation domain-containing protein